MAGTRRNPGAMLRKGAENRAKVTLRTFAVEAAGRSSIGRLATARCEKWGALFERTNSLGRAVPYIQVSVLRLRRSAIHRSVCKIGTTFKCHSGRIACRFWVPKKF